MEGSGKNSSQGLRQGWGKNDYMEKSDEFYSWDRTWLRWKVQKGLMLDRRQGSRKTSTYYMTNERTKASEENLLFI